MQKFFDSRWLRDCFGQFATGVTVVTYKSDEGEARGVTLNSFTSVSLEPALLLVSIAKSARACAALEGKSFAVNVLAREQREIAMQFAGRPSDGLEIGWVDGELAPRLDGALAWFECRPWNQYDGGDHVLLVGEVTRCEARKTEPLLYFGGQFHSVEESV